MTKHGISFLAIGRRGCKDKWDENGFELVTSFARITASIGEAV
jgi:hypothetical protein